MSTQKFDSVIPLGKESRLGFINTTRSIDREHYRTTLDVIIVSSYVKNFLCLLVASPKVQVYSREPGEFGKPNTIICHVSGFHPPEITIELLHNGNEIPGAQQTDLAFEENWHYHLTKFAKFTPQQGSKYSCRVRHMVPGGMPKEFNWGMFVYWLYFVYCNKYH